MDFIRKNEQIRHPQVLVVMDGNKLGVYSSRDAQAMARNEGLDLVEVAPQAKPPVCAIVDFGKYMYERSKAKKTKSNTVKEKEICFRYVIDTHDLETKINQAKKFLSKGDRVKLIVKFKARENAHRDQGFDVIRSALDMLKDYAVVEKSPLMEGNSIVAKLVTNGKKYEKADEDDLDEKTTTPPTNKEELKVGA